MEELLSYVWQYQLYTSSPLETTNHLPVEVIDPGRRYYANRPVFIDAKIRIDHTLWVGTILIHPHLPDTSSALTEQDFHPGAVILEVYEPRSWVNHLVTHTDEAIPQLILSSPTILQDRYTRLRSTNTHPACLRFLGTIDKPVLKDWFEWLALERLKVKERRIKELFQTKDYLWGDIFFITLARNLGFGTQGDQFEQWAMSLPFRALDKHRDSLFQLEALFFGLAGLLQTEPADRYMRELQDEFAFLSVKFDLPRSGYPWVASSLRPGKYPHIHIAQLAWLYNAQPSLLSALCCIKGVDAISKQLLFKTSAYWETHIIFGKEVSRREKSIGKRAKELIIINTISPFLYAYAHHKQNDLVMEYALSLLTQLKPEQNSIVELWRSAHLPIENARDTQALIQLQKRYCDRSQCLTCRLGYALLVEGLIDEVGQLPRATRS